MSAVALFRCRAAPDKVLQRGQRLGIIKLGSTVELSIPESANPRIAVEQGQRVRGGLTVLAHVGPIHPDGAARPQDRPDHGLADAEPGKPEPEPEDHDR